jgi:hypothetical protein
MARRHGRNGRLYMGIANSGATPSPVAFLSKWQLQAATDQVEATAFGDSNKTYLTGLPDAQGSFSGFWDDATAQSYTAALDGNARMFYLYPDAVNAAGVYWSGTAFFDFTVDVDVAGAVTVSGNWRAAGPVAKTG